MITQQFPIPYSIVAGEKEWEIKTIILRQLKPYHIYLEPKDPNDPTNKNLNIGLIINRIPYLYLPNSKTIANLIEIETNNQNQIIIQSTLNNIKFSGSIITYPLWATGTPYHLTDTNPVWHKSYKQLMKQIHQHITQMTSSNQ